VSRYRFIEVEKVNHAVRTLCRVLQVSRAAYYHWSIHPLSAHASTDLVLSNRIAAIHARSRQTYGAPRVHAELRICGERHSRKRIARLMRRAGIAGRVPRRYRRTTVYTSEAYTNVLERHGIRSSLSRPGNCWDNAVAESFFSTLKLDLLDRQSWPTRAAARSAIFEYIEGFYNRERRHTTLGNLSPATIPARCCVLGLANVSVKPGHAHSTTTPTEMRVLCGGPFANSPGAKGGPQWASFQ
jgi:hypothetical protein